MVDRVTEIREALALQDDVESAVLTLSGMEWLVGPIDRVFEAARACVSLLDNGQAMREALEAIINFDPAWESWEHPDPDCEDCKRAKDNRWPPSGLCHVHYSPFADQQRRNQRAVDSQWLDMKQIARSALSAVVPEEGP